MEEFARYAAIPTVNALTDEEHPCQILADIFTFQEKRGPIQGRIVTFIGDGACNVVNSWIFAAAKLGFELRIAAPKAFQPSQEMLGRAGGRVFVTESPKEAARGANLAGDQISGLAVLSIDPKEFTVVNIVGPIDLEKLSKLEGQFGVPDLGIEREKPKKKD